MEKRGPMLDMYAKIIGRCIEMEIAIEFG